MTWAANSNVTISNLNRVQGTLTVELIMVARSDFLTCSREETADQVKQKNPDHFSYIPVEENGLIIGLYDAERWFHTDAPMTAIEDDFALLSEENVLGADASIFDFIRQADDHSTNLIVSGNKISGLVSLSDLQQLPVRASLFTLITSLEMAMAIAIESKWPESSEWIKLLSTDRGNKLRSSIESAKDNESFVSEIAFTQFSDKTTLICKGKFLELSRPKAKTAFNRIRALRDNISHANHYAETPDDAKSVCETVRAVYKIREMLTSN